MHFIQRTKKYQSIQDGDLIAQGNWNNMVKFTHVKGHVYTNLLNSQCDHLANLNNRNYPKLSLILKRKSTPTNHSKLHEYYRIRDIIHAWSNNLLSRDIIQIANALDRALTQAATIVTIEPVVETEIIVTQPKENWWTDIPPTGDRLEEMDRIYDTTHHNTATSVRDVPPTSDRLEKMDRIRPDVASVYDATHHNTATSVREVLADSID